MFTDPAGFATPQARSRGSCSPEARLATVALDVSAFASFVDSP
jgi:hypothetical protein